MTYDLDTGEVLLIDVKTSVLNNYSGRRVSSVTPPTRANQEEQERLGVKYLLVDYDSEECAWWVPTPAMPEPKQGQCKDCGTTKSNHGRWYFDGTQCHQCNALYLKHLDDT
jgi:hypothetical protein